MEDKKALVDITSQIKEIMRNNENNIASMNSIEMMLTSNNNGTTKDSNISGKVNNLKSRIQETINATNEIISMINEDR